MKENVIRQRIIVYMNESYNNKNYCCREDYMYYPNEDQDLTTIAHHKGHHYCFISAIVDADHSFPEFDRTDAQKTVLLHDTLDIFEGGKIRQRTIMEFLIMHTLWDGCASCWMF